MQVHRQARFQFIFDWLQAGGALNPRAKFSQKYLFRSIPLYIEATCSP